VGVVGHAGACCLIRFQGRGYIAGRYAYSSAFIEPCLPSPADRPPSGSNRINENLA
jgi:hypothetical protein